ncbi:ECF transporter S component [Adlercreutzia equolifaciens]|uniref:ECF transporter S component n=1 Tax=Adlercreutzia equolifaciens TaxID=446660 RepID=UPI0026720F27|nr:ECF transporter S component [Adlercreutzia equolifaciens]
MPELTPGPDFGGASARGNRQGRAKTLVTVIGALILTPLTVVLGMEVPGSGYYLSGTLIVLYALAPFFVSFEGRRPQAREIAVVAVLAALAVVARAAFVWVPHFKPMAAIVMIAGIAAGPQTGFLVGSVAALASNFIFGQGPWTPWQMLAFGVAGLVAGLLADARVFPRANLTWPRRIALAVTGFVLIVGLVGPILDTSTFFYLSTAPTLELATAVYLAGLPVNAAHGAAVAVTLLLVANPLLDQLDRLRVKYGLLDRRHAPHRN